MRNKFAMANGSAKVSIPIDNRYKISYNTYSINWYYRFGVAGCGLCPKNA
ncbi:hypothetical protein GCM10020370_12580 [Paenibacillus hodogayensis]